MKKTVRQLLVLFTCLAIVSDGLNVNVFADEITGQTADEAIITETGTGAGISEDGIFSGSENGIEEAVVFVSENITEDTLPAGKPEESVSGQVISESVSGQKAEESVSGQILAEAGDVVDTGNKKKIEAAGSYANWDGVTNVAQFRGQDGGLYYAIDSDDVVKVYKVENGVPQSGSITLEKKHPIFGTAICDKNGNFYLVTGESNDTDDTTVETIFISKYDSSGKFIATTGDNGSSSLASYYDSSFYTREPFQGGNCDAAIFGDILTVNYARLMYSGHQSNSVFSVNMTDMSKVNMGVFYESHSFAQRVVPTDEGVVYASEGDCYDRAFTIYNAKVANNEYSSGSESTIFDFWVEDGALDNWNMYVVNENFAHMGGLAALSDGAVAMVSQSAKSLDSNAKSEKEDIFIQIFDPDKDLKTADAYITTGERSGLAGPNGRDEVTNYGVKWLTSCGSDSSINNVQVVSTSDDEIIVLYEYYQNYTYKGVYYIVLDKMGNVLCPATLFNASARLNPCEMPVYTGEKVCWVGNKYGDSTYGIYAYSLELSFGSIPRFSPEAGRYTVSQNVTISCQDKDLTIYYTTDGSTPTKDSTLYTGPVFVGEDTTIKAVSVSADGKVSRVATAAYVIGDKSDASVTVAGDRNIVRTYGDKAFTLNATASDEGEGEGSWTWSSSDKGVADVYGSGRTAAISIKGAGSAQITARYDSDTTTGKAVVSLTVGKKELDIKYTETEFTYDGDMHIPTADISGVLTGDICTVSLSGNGINAGDYVAEACLEGDDAGNYMLRDSEKVCHFTILKADISDAVVTLGEKLTYNGEEQTQEVASVKLGKSDISESCIIYNNKGKDAGNYRMIIKAKENGNCYGSLSVHFSIARKAVTPVVKVIGNYVYKGYSIIPKVSVSADGIELKEGDFIISVSDNVNAGTGRVTVRENGNYTFEEQTIDFVIEKAVWKGLSSNSLKKKYLFSEESSDSVEIESYLPSDCGDIYWSEVKTSGEITYSELPDIRDGRLYYTVRSKDKPSSGTVTLSAQTENYSNVFSFCVDISLQTLAIHEKSGKNTVNCSEKSIAIGKKFSLLPVFIEGGVSNNRVVWASSNPDIATVTQKGKVTARSAGRCIIYARSEERQEETAECSLHVYEPVTAVTLDKKKYSFGTGESLIINAQVLPMEAEQKLKWTANNDKVDIRVSKDTLSATVKGVKAGNVRITATAQDGSKKKASCNLKIGKPVPDYIVSGNGGVSSVRAGKNLKMVVNWGEKKNKPCNCDMIWKVTDLYGEDASDIAEISNKGVLTGIMPGKVSVNAISKANPEKTNSTVITILKPSGSGKDIISGISFNNAENLKNKGLKTGKGYKLKTDLVMSENGTAAGDAVAWITSDCSVATVSQKGQVKAVASGTVTITAVSRYSDNVFTAPSASVSFNVFEGVKTIKADKKKLALGTQEGSQYGRIAVAKISPENVTDASIKWTANNQNVQLARISKGGEDGNHDLTESAEDAEYVEEGQSVVTDSGEALAIKALSPGVTKLTGMAVDGSKKKVVCTVTIRGTITGLRLIPGKRGLNDLKLSDDPETDVAEYVGSVKEGTSVSLKTVVDIDDLAGDSTDNKDKKRLKQFRKYTDTSISYRSSDVSVATVNNNGKITVKKATAGREVNIYAVSADGKKKAMVRISVE